MNSRITAISIMLAVMLIFTGRVALAIPVIFEADVSGSQTSIETYRPINDPPPPSGTGRVSIAGNQSELGSFTPNRIFLSDDGVGPDAIARDNIWTGRFDFLPGTQLLYKYAIGNEGNPWSGTEEFAVTMRGYLLPTDPAIIVRIHDIFADRPDTDGMLAPRSEVTIQPVPEPGTVLFFLIGLGVPALCKHRSRLKRIT